MRDTISPMAWSPLAGGRLLSGVDMPPELVETLDRLAAREGVDRAALACAFTLCHPSKPVTILGTQNIERLAMSAEILDVQLDRNDCYDIIEASEGVPLP